MDYKFEIKVSMVREHTAEQGVPSPSLIKQIVEQGLKKAYRSKEFKAVVDVRIVD